MKKYFFILLVVLAVSAASFGQVLKKKENYSFSFGSIHTTYSFIKNPNIYLSVNNGIINNHFVYETSWCSQSMIEQYDKRYYSLNSYPLVIMPLALAVAYTGSEWLALPVFILSLPAIIPFATNFKIGYSINDNILLLIGQRTDYYAFYPVSRICTQSQIGLRTTYKKICVSAFINYPWTKGYYNNRDPHICLGLGYMNQEH
jgi:hypothetical protein